MNLTLNKIVPLFTYFLLVVMPIGAETCKANEVKEFVGLEKFMNTPIVMIHLIDYFPNRYFMDASPCIVNEQNNLNSSSGNHIKHDNSALTENQEYDLKATFIYRFTDYIEWKNNDKSVFFMIAVLGESPITQPLFEIAKDKKVKNKKIVVLQYRNLEEIGFCNILFVPKNCSIPVDSILNKFEDKPVLIITEHEGYAKKGVHFNFVLIENKLKFEVNPKALNKSKIFISSFLLQHAIIIE
jgi:hypothetical protein